MPLNMQDKQTIVSAVNQEASVALSAVIADYRGLSVSEMTELRKQARESGVFLKVVRNTLARRALKGTDFECLDSSLVGPLVFAFAKDDPGSSARLIKSFSASHNKLEVKALSVGGKIYGASDIDVLAKLPTRDQALAILMQVMLAPVTKLARTLNEIPTKGVRVIAAVKDQKQEAA